MPRWRAGLALGDGAALTLVLLTTFMAIALAWVRLFAVLGAFIGNAGSFTGRGKEFILVAALKTFGTLLSFAGIYLLGILTLGTLSAWLGAWAQLRFQLLRPRMAESAAV